MQLKTFLGLLVLAFLVAFACNEYMQAGDVSGLKQGVKNIVESTQTRADQLREINQELARQNNR